MGEQRREPAARVHKVGYANRAIKKKRCKRTRRGESTVSVALQDLFVSCKQVFKGPDSVPLPQDIKRLCNLLDFCKCSNKYLVDGFREMSNEYKDLCVFLTYPDQISLTTPDGIKKEISLCCLVL
ncbi:hypothetical protein OIU77_015232 [Salix suchowensis]|uniref:Uncharacterized protein n=1 Tax=Salix suchowensis TaxID=1278906 RepID=A0ABQ8ZS30_9ROSI|nr:hypothetical protein OIU77_015232 [Salix suchowensis]